MLGLARDEFPHADRQLLVSVASPYTCTTVYFFVSLPRGEGEGGGGGKRAGGIWEGNTEEGRGRGERGTLKKKWRGGGKALEVEEKRGKE